MESKFSSFHKRYLQTSFMAKKPNQLHLGSSLLCSYTDPFAYKYRYIPHSKTHQSNHIPCFLFLFSCSLFFKVLWQEESFSSNQSLSLGSEHSNISREVI